MSDPIDIKALDEYLKGGSEVSQRYRDLGRDDVPPELDRRVLDEARAAVASERVKRSRSWLRWSAPLALAASVVLAIAVVLESGVQNDATVQPPAAQSAPLPSVSAPAPVAPPPQESVAKDEAQRSYNFAPEPSTASAPTLRGEVRSVQPIAVPKQAEEAKAVEDAAAAADTEAETEADSADLDGAPLTGSRTRRAQGRTAGPRTTASGLLHRSELKEATAVQAAHPLRSDPEKWLEAIRQLRRDGKTAQADLEWQRFSTAFPDFHVADEDLARPPP